MIKKRKRRFKHNIKVFVSFFIIFNLDKIRQVTAFKNISKKNSLIRISNNNLVINKNTFDKTVNGYFTDFNKNIFFFRDRYKKTRLKNI